MSGSGIDLIVIPIVMVSLLAVWLGLVAYAASRPRWKHRPPDRD